MPFPKSPRIVLRTNSNISISGLGCGVGIGFGASGLPKPLLTNVWTASYLIPNAFFRASPLPKSPFHTLLLILRRLYLEMGVGIFSAYPTNVFCLVNSQLDQHIHFRYILQNVNVILYYYLLFLITSVPNVSPSFTISPTFKWLFEPLSKWQYTDLQPFACNNVTLLPPLGLVVCPVTPFTTLITFPFANAIIVPRVVISIALCHPTTCTFVRLNFYTKNLDIHIHLNDLLYLFCS